MITGQSDSPLDRDDNSTSSDGQHIQALRRGRRWYLIRITMMSLGLLLLAGAIVFVFNHRQDMAGVQRALAQPRALPIVLILGSMVLTILLTGWQFQLLLARHRLPTLEMMALISGSALLNFLPLKVGLLGRVTYHQAVHGIRPLETIRAMIFGYTMLRTIDGM